MKNTNLLSDKDLQLLKITYRTIIENYYDNPSEQNSRHIILINSLTTQIISSTQQSDAILLISVLEVLKVKAKANRQLVDSIQNTVIHLKNPLKIHLSSDILQETLDIIQLFNLSCTIISRFFQAEMKPRIASYDWKDIIIKVSKNSDKNMSLALEVLTLLLPHFQNLSKDVSKSGFVKYICSVYLTQVLDDKNSLYRALKALRLISMNDRTILLSRQKNLSTVIYHHSRYILVVREISEGCFDTDYCQKIINLASDVDSIFLWSYNYSFCSLANQRIIDRLQEMLQNKNISEQIQFKIYSSLHNFLKSDKQLQIKRSTQIPKHAEKNLNAYLKLAIANIENNDNNFKDIDLKTIQYIYEKSKTTDPVTVQLIKNLKQLDPSLKNKKTVGSLAPEILESFSFQNNPDYLMENAMNIPKNRKQAKFLQEILDQKSKRNGQFQNDMILMIKQKALDSLRQAIIERREINFPQIVNNFNIDSNRNPQNLDKIIKMIELYLTMNPDDNRLFDQQKFKRILEYLQNNHSEAIIDWVAAGQVLSFLFGPDQWKKHLNQIPDRCYWLLNANSQQLTKELIGKINSISLNHKKIPVIIGFLSKTNDEGLKKLLLDQTKLVDYATKNIVQNSNNSAIRASTSSVFSSMTQSPQQKSEIQKFLSYNRNIINLSYLIYNWEKGKLSKELESRVIIPVLENMYRYFYGTEQQFKFLENSLPHKIDLSRLQNLNTGKLLETHGKLVSYLHSQKYPGKIDYGIIHSLGSELDPTKISQTLKFLSEHPDLLEGQDFNLLISKLMPSKKPHNKYWKLFPHYITILEYLLEIAEKTHNTGIQQNLAQIFEKLIDSTANNPDITPEQLDDLYEALYETLKKLIDKGVYFEVNKVKRQAQKIPNQAIRNKIIDLLKNGANNQKIILEEEKIDLVEEKTGNKFAALNKNTGTENRQDKSKILDQLHIQTSEELKKREKGEHIQNININTNQALHSQEKNIPNQSVEDLALLDALKLLKKIIKKQQPKEIFPKLVEVFMKSQFNKNRRYILGHLLTEYYEVIQKNQKVIALLQLKDKTNLSKQICYNFLKKFEDAFMIAKRWKLSGKQFMDLAMERLKCQNQNKVFCVENGCEITEYNLLRTSDLNYFDHKKIHHYLVELLNKIQAKEELIYFLLLIGTSSRLTDIKSFYNGNSVHIRLLRFIQTKQWAEDPKVVANMSYALSSLSYTQAPIATEIVKQKPQLLELLSCYKKFSCQKIVVQSACSLLSNLCYSNKETKQILFQYGVIKILLIFMKDNLSKPQVSTYKQIMRAIGNTSLHRQSAQLLIDSQISAMIVQMIEKLNIFIYRDEQKIKILKLTVDMISNLTTHKYKLEKIHEEGVTNFVMTLIETTDISEDHVMMGCIDTIDGLCQLPLVQNYVVMDKNLPLMLIDLLKVKQDQKLITKSIRLLTNMTINQICIPYILNSNLLSVLANIVLPVYKNAKIQTYVNKIILRIYHNKPSIKLLLKSGYIDCLMKLIQICQTIDDDYIDILLHYSQHIPNYLNHRAFMNLIRLLTTKPHVKQIVEKCLKIFKIIFSSEERSDDDVLIEGSPQMYEKLLTNYEQNRSDVLYIIGLHCIKSVKFKMLVKSLHQKKKSDLLNIVFRLSQLQTNRELAFPVLFCILNHDNCLVNISRGIVQEEEMAFKFFSKGVKCRLFRLDGSSKAAIIDINSEYLLRAYKYPDGQIKKKYTVSIRQIKNWQFLFRPNDDAWKHSIFARVKTGILQDQVVIERCITLLGSRQWGEFTYLNIQFQNMQIKTHFMKAISAIIMAFKSTS